MKEGAFIAPRFDLVKKDVKGFVNELQKFHKNFKGCFERSEPKKNFFRYMVGQFSKIERKSVEPIALKVEGGNVRNMQRCLSDAKWDEDKMLAKYWEMLNDDIGDENGVLIFDESGFPKKGNDSAGVARQYCGTLGKVDNCQVGVFCAYASSQNGYSLLDKQLFVPEKWFTDEYADRRKKCNFPKKLKFKTKPQLASTMLKKVEEKSCLPSKNVVADTVYGNSPDFVETIESFSGKIYLLAIPSDTLFWLHEPITKEKQ